MAAGKKEQAEEFYNEAFEAAKAKVIGIDRQRLGIGTYGEKTVHAIFKHYYEPEERLHEVPVGRYVADICNGRDILEIQTGQFNRMREKLAAFLPEYSVTIVHPIPRIKWLIWIDEESGELSVRRKSPKKGNAYHAFKELYRIKMFLLDPNLHLKLVLTDMEEYRLLNGWSKDKKKGSTRYDRIPSRLVETVEIRCPEDYMQFVPMELEGEFTVKQFAKAAHIPVRLAQTVVHILAYVGTIEKTGQEGKAYLYRAAW